MPLTQYFWTWDRFLHGGQDFELGALMVLTNLSLALVLAMICRRGKQLPAPSRLLSGAASYRALAASALLGILPFSQAVTATGLGQDYRIPLQI